MRMLDHTTVVHMRHCFYSTTEKNEVYLNLVLEYVSETVYRVSRHYNRVNHCAYHICSTVHVPAMSGSELLAQCNWGMSP
ncbi:hypothetical protein K7X08_026475 [Anisodus acutangulus]|uniref:Uncharacterized protein n=1 Tax=Anisodus acutangulus TaxID=402998 RepID=A0A9Q1R4Y9_9SOLA|nr:hypothetical protein K7X08_026475 [Anisodus acutangulus]